jgi:hypothetical protein
MLRQLIVSDDDKSMHPSHHLCHCVCSMARVCLIHGNPFILPINHSAKIPFLGIRPQQNQCCPLAFHHRLLL